MPNIAADAADGAPNLASYADNGDGTITDLVTKLVWQKVPSSTVFRAFNDAKAYCADLVLGGYDDWRVPTRIELLSIVDYGRENPAIDPVFGPGQPATNFATLPRTNASVWSVSFLTGSATASGYSEMTVVRCVR